MAKNKPGFNVEISDIFDDEQEDYVIEKVGERVRQSAEELKEYFKTTDSIEIKRLSEEEAKALCDALDGHDLNVRMYDVAQKQVEREDEKIRCPKCGAVMEALEWRCPECYHEFPEYDFQDDTSEG